MARGRKTKPADVLRWLREVDGLVAAGRTRAEACREIGISSKSYYMWRSRYGGQTLDEIVESGAVKRENEQLRRLVAEMALRIRALEDVVRGKP
jgi:putative transposase